MSTVILIPAVRIIITDSGEVRHQPIVRETQPSANHTRIVWESPVSFTARNFAKFEAEAAVESLCYERRHQLPLALEA